MRARALVALAVTLALGAATAYAADQAPEPAVTTEPIGRSAQDRPIGVTRMRVADERVRRRVLVVGCVHGDECAGRAIVARLRAQEELPRGLELLLVSNLNPDGLALGRRQNARGVDLNRNSSAGRRDLGPPGSPTYAGPSAWSEPESRAIRELDPAHAPRRRRLVPPAARRRRRPGGRLGRPRPPLRPPRRAARAPAARLPRLALALGQRAGPRRLIVRRGAAGRPAVRGGRAPPRRRGARDQPFGGRFSRSAVSAACSRRSRVSGFVAVCRRWRIA